VNNYARCMKQLQQWGYIRYISAANLYLGSQVTVIRFDTGTDTGSDTASYYINITNFNKQDLIKKMNNGRGKKPSGIRQIHVSNDKDYSEPL